MARQVRRHGRVADGTYEGTEDENRRLKKMYAEELTKSGSAISTARDGAVDRGTAISPINLACQAFGVSQTCYRYKAKLDAENSVIADWLVRLTNNQRNWGFGLCFLYLRNVKEFKWNHKRGYRIYRELELNLRIKPRHRLVREKPLPLAVLPAINQSWSMDFMHDQRADGYLLI